MVAARVDYAKVVARARDVKINGSDNGVFRVLEIYGDYSSNGTSDLLKLNISI